MKEIGQIILARMIPERAESPGLTICPDLCHGIDTVHSPDHVPQSGCFSVNVIGAHEVVEALRPFGSSCTGIGKKVVRSLLKTVTI